MGDEEGNALAGIQQLEQHLIWLHVEGLLVMPLGLVILHTVLNHFAADVLSHHLFHLCHAPRVVPKEQASSGLHKYNYQPIWKCIQVRAAQL